MATANGEDPIAWRFARAQGPVLTSFARLAFCALFERTRTHRAATTGGRLPSLPGPHVERTFAPRTSDHLAAYTAHVGAEAHGGFVPPHLFPHWCFALTGQLVGKLPFNMLSAVNAGCDVRVHARMPAAEPIRVRGWLEAIDESERRVLITQRFVTSTPSVADALEADVTLLLMRKAPKGSVRGSKPKSAPERVPDGVGVIGRFEAGAEAGLDFAKLTGDFNPLHWSAGYARMLGFRQTILHGFGTASRAWAALERHRERPLKRFACRFPRPVPLPAAMGIYARGDEVWVGEAPGDTARLIGSFE